MSRAMSAVELVIMTAVICVSLGVMLALVFVAARQSDGGRSLSGQSRGGSVHGGIHIGHARSAGPEYDARATRPASRPIAIADPSPPSSPVATEETPEMPAQRRDDR